MLGMVPSDLLYRQIHRPRGDRDSSEGFRPDAYLSIEYAFRIQNKEKRLGKTSTMYLIGTEDGFACWAKPRGRRLRLALRRNALAFGRHGARGAAPVTLLLILNV